MSSEKNTIIGIVLCVLFFLAYTEWFNKKYPTYGKKPLQTSEAIESAGTTPPLNRDDRGSAATRSPADAANHVDQTSPETKIPGKTESSENFKKLSEEDLIFKTNTSSYRLSQTHSSIDSIRLFNYRSHIDTASGPIDLLDSPLIIQGVSEISKSTAIASEKGFQGVRDGRRITFTREANGWQTSQDFKFPDSGYGVDIVIRFVNASKERKILNAGVLLSTGLKIPKQSGGFLSPGTPERFNVASSAGGKATWSDLQKPCSETTQDPIVAINNDSIDFFGFDHQYFLTSMLPLSKKLSFTIKRAINPSFIVDTTVFCPVIGLVSEDFGFVEPGQQIEIPFRAYFGPKSIEQLNTYDAKLQTAIDLGWFDSIARPLLMAIKWLFTKTGNYGLAIIIMTIIFKILFYPLTKQAAISALKMKKLQPEMNRIKEQYKDNREIQQRELMKFMSTHKMNPMKGCLPVLPQIPVFFAFYSMLSAAIELRHAPFLLWIKDLSAQDPYYISPLLLGAGMFLQQRLTPMSGMDKTQEKIMMFMPLVFTFMMLTLPSGLVIYMLTNTIISIVQQQWLNKKLGPGKAE